MDTKIYQDYYITIFKNEVQPHLPFDCYDWLSDRGFFSAPASTKYHGSFEGGLFLHSYEVMIQLVELTSRNHLSWIRPESPYIVGFFHDLCKIDSYVSDGYNTDIHDFSYSFNSESLFKGHGKKSVMLLSTLTQLTEEEAACICYHMGAFTDKEEWNDYTRAIHSYPNVLWTHHADMIAAHISNI